MSPENSNVTENLRIRAERLLDQTSENFQPSDIEDINKLHHELAVHQAELELQNEELRRTQLSLQIAYDRYAELYENAPVGYVLLDDSGIIRRTNAAWRAMLWRPNHNFHGTPFAETLVQGDDRVFLSRFRSFFHNPAEKQIELRIKRNNSEFFYAQITTKHSSHEQADNDTNELMIIVSDITERKRAEDALRESEERFKALHNASFGGIAIHDQGLILDCNQGLSEISGFSHDELIGMDGLLLIAEQSRKTVMNKMRSGYEKPYEALGLRKNGAEYPLHLEARSIPYHGKIVRVVEFRDITERTRVQLALKQKNDEMEQLVYSVSHDLKSPLVTVKTFVSILKNDLQESDLQAINKSFNYIDKAANKMQQLLDALLEYSRIGTVDTPPQSLSAGQPVEDCLNTLAGILQQQQVQVTVGDMPYQLHGPPIHFGQLWQNLIENAVKYRGDQPLLRIEIGATQQGHDVVFYVRDSGIGIALEHRERIFNLFSQLNPDSDGSGLGLALVKKIVSIYQGRIWVESKGAGRGSCFNFTLPGALIKGDKAI